MSKRTTVKMGIYRIRNLKNKKVYIGSSKSLNRRWIMHRYHLRKGSHRNRHLQGAWNKDGEDSFSFEVIQFVSEEINLLELEQKYLDQYKSYDRISGYNFRRYAESNRGTKMPDGFSEKMSKLHKGKVVSEETRALISKAHIGKKKSASSIKKLVDARRGKKHSEETKRKIGAAHKGKFVSERTRKKLSKIRKEQGTSKGKNNPMYGRTGENTPRARLDWEKVGIIRGSEKPIRALAAQFGVHENTIRAVVSYQTWKIDDHNPI